MNVQHNENTDMQEFGDIGLTATPVEKEQPKVHKKYGMVAVANGTGLIKVFKELNVDEVVSGGQTMNTSTKDFIEAFDRIDADYIFVYPNNGNILMAAKQAAENYTKAKIIVIPTKTIAQGYSAVSMLSFEDDDLEGVLECQKEIISGVNTMEVTYSIRDAKINGVSIKKGDYICLYNDELIASATNRLSALKLALKKIPNFNDMQVMTILCGQDVQIEEVNQLENYAKTLNKFVEVYPIQGNQDIYSYIIGIE